MTEKNKINIKCKIQLKSKYIPYEDTRNISKLCKKCEMFQITIAHLNCA